ncbi:MAG TPA: family 78 glycoside hydrolase catalytic domain [bacterium]|nr:family 78 glycoside hydrolase catalytic domain [bacterium]
MTEQFHECGWVWYETPGYDDLNVYMMARKEFEISKIPSQAEIKITADYRYKLYVNGNFVCFGPARGYPEHYVFDRVDVAGYLRKGKNVLAVLVHQPGIGTFHSIYAGGAGLLISGNIAGIDIGTKRKNWLVKKCPGHRQDTVRRSIQMGFQECFDATKIEPDWKLPGADIKDGKNGWCMESYWKPAGCAPWFNFEERGIPLLHTEIGNFKKITGIYLGDMYPDWEQCKNLTKVYFNEMHGTNAAELIKNAENILHDNNCYAEILPVPAGKRLTLILDAGEEITGFIGIEAKSEEETVVDLTTAEVLKNGFVYVDDPEKSGCKIAISDRVVFRKGTNHFETFYIHGFRYLAVTFRNVTNNLKLYRIYIRKINYPFEKKTQFECSDEQVNKVWEMCVRTQENCAWDSYIDCPWREQAQWWGDARVQGMNTYYMFNDMRLFRRGIKQAGESQIENGLTYGHFPTTPSGNILPDFTLMWIHTHLDYYKFTGDKTLMKEQFQKMERAISFFHRYITKFKLLPPMPEYWVFFDWAPLYKQGYSTVFNLLYLSTLQCMVEICNTLKKDKTFYQRQAELVEKRIIKYFWSEQDKVFYDGLDIETNEPVKKISQHTHALAVLTGVKHEFHRKFCEEVLIPPMKKPPLVDTKIIEASPYFYFYVIEALKKIGGYEPDIEQFIKERWGNMLQQDATTCWEMWNPKPGITSLCHAWSAHPAVHLINIAGIVPLSPKWKKFLIKPCLLRVDWLNVKIPVRTGNIVISMKKHENKLSLSIQIPDEITCISTIDKSKKILKPGIHKLEKNLQTDM